ncbi:MAG: DNA polymerase III subunit gamma/tau [Spirochaetales bacterium]|nr:DNA polymerase III subunit gamma/tau [Spirochaetales bacterium]
MPYEITASRKRPRSFDELAGQEFVSSTLRSTIESGRIAHAYLFSGPRGCGKTSTARILARSLNCEKGPTADPCGECDNCKAIRAGSSMDVIEIDGASNTSVENVRQIKDEVLFPPNSSRYKIYIIDEVHMLSNSAFNALLKTIEEPPPYVVFVFATTELHKVPATIKSRCQQFGFRLIPLETIARLLREAATEIGAEADEDALLWIAKEATGSLRDAYTLFDQVAAFSEGKITALKIRDKLGLVGLDRMNELMADCARGDRASALERLDALLDRGVSPEQWVVDAVEYWRAILFLRSGVSKPGVLGAPAAAFDRAVVDALAPEKIERALAGLLQLHRDLRSSVDPRYELELAVSRLAGLASAVTAAEAARAVGELRAYIRSGAAASAPSGAPGFAEALGPATDLNGGEKKKPERLGCVSGVSPGDAGALAHSRAPDVPAVAVGRDAGGSPGVPEAERLEDTPRAGAADTSVPAKPAAGPVILPPPTGSSVFDEDDDGPSEDGEAIRPQTGTSREPVRDPGLAGSRIAEGRVESPNSVGAPEASPRKEAPELAGRDAAAIREATLALLRKADFVLAGALEKAVAWRVEGAKLVIEFERPYEENMARAELALVSRRVADSGGSGLSVDIRPLKRQGESAEQRAAPSPAGEAPRAASRPEGAPDPVELVERVFRGRRVPQTRGERSAGDDNQDGGSR